MRLTQLYKLWHSELYFLSLYFEIIPIYFIILLFPFLFKPTFSQALQYKLNVIIIKLTTRMGFEPTRGDPNGLAVHRLNHSATSSVEYEAPIYNTVHILLLQLMFIQYYTQHVQFKSIFMFNVIIQTNSR